MKAFSSMPPQPQTPPLILVHGAAGTHLHWPPNLRHLPSTPVYALDLPGHGDSPDYGLSSLSDYAGAVIDWAVRRGLNRYVVGGHSMGSGIALECALAAPEQVAGLILVGAGARLRVHPDILKGVQQDFPATAEQLTDWSWGTRPQGQTRARIVQELLANDPALVLADYLACNAWDRLADITQIRCPALVICGERDLMTPVKYSQYLVAHLPNAELALIPDAGHMVQLEQPKLVSLYIQRFMQRIT